MSEKGLETLPRPATGGISRQAVALSLRLQRVAPDEMPVAAGQNRYLPLANR